MHDDIVKFPLSGEIGDANIVEQKQRFVNFLENQMRETGYVPMLDLEPQFTLDYRPESESFRFELSVYGVHVGDTAWQVSGVMNGTTIMKSTQRARSSTP